MTTCVKAKDSPLTIYQWLSANFSGPNMPLPPQHGKAYSQKEPGGGEEQANTEGRDDRNEGTDLAVLAVAAMRSPSHRLPPQVDRCYGLSTVTQLGGDLQPNAPV